MAESTDVVWHEQAVERARGCVVWFTGLSGSGKSTVANLVDVQLNERGAASYVLDGDNVRHGLNASPAMLTEQYGEEYANRFGLTFAPQDREENIRRIGSVADLFCDASVIALTAFVSPYRRDRDLARSLVEGSGSKGDFVEVFVDTPIEICETRDPKGLYKQARAGKIKGFTGIDAPYEPPASPELHLSAGEIAPDVLAAQVVEYLVAAGKVT